jgi:hypothetical protein
MNVNSLLLYLNGHKLPYNSIKYPELSDKTHPNCKEEILEELLIYIKAKNIKIIAVLTTTGHAGGFFELNEDAKIEILNSDISIENTLISFPEHLRQGKLSKKEGAAQLGYGVLCHNKDKAQTYAENILKEVIELYGTYFDGIALHPPESAYPCCCESCVSKFYKSTGTNLYEADLSTSRKFYIKSYLEYQEKVLFELIRKSKPNCKLLTFTIPWLFEGCFDELSHLISKEIFLIEWDYNLQTTRIEGLQNRLREYMNFGNPVWFMPTAGFSFCNDTSIQEQIHAVFLQMKIAEESGVKGIVHFLGPKISNSLIETSRKNYKDSKNLF